MASFLKSVDEAFRVMLYNKFKDDMDLTASSEVLFYPKSVAMRKFSEKKGKAAVGFLSFWRQNVIPAPSRMANIVPRQGQRLAFKDNTKVETVTVKSLAVDLPYTLHFWSNSYDMIQQVQETYAFWQYKDPNLDMTVNSSYNIEIDLQFGEMVDESPIDAFFEKGEYFVLSVPVKLEAWIFEFEDLKNIHKIVLTFYDYTYKSTGEMLFTRTYQLDTGSGT